MKIGIISGSHRPKSNSRKVGAYYEYLLPKLDSAITTDLFNCAEELTPEWKEDAWDENSKMAKDWQKVAERLRECDGFVVIAPEWSGMVPSALKNFFLFCSFREIGHKPALITSVSSGIGGTYPITELRNSSYKNTRILYIPEHIIVRDADKALNSLEKAENSADEYIRNRMASTSKLLIEYCRAMNVVRAKPDYFDFKSYANGM